MFHKSNKSSEPKCEKIAVKKKSSPQKRPDGKKSEEKREHTRSRAIFDGQIEGEKFNEWVTHTEDKGKIHVMKEYESLKTNLNKSLADSFFSNSNKIRYDGKTIFFSQLLP